jgi:hypothetical protein
MRTYLRTKFPANRKISRVNSRTCSMKRSTTGRKVDHRSGSLSDFSAARKLRFVPPSRPVVTGTVAIPRMMS